MIMLRLMLVGAKNIPTNFDERLPAYVIHPNMWVLYYYFCIKQLILTNHSCIHEKGSYISMFLLRLRQVTCLNCTFVELRTCYFAPHSSALMLNASWSFNVVIVLLESRMWQILGPPIISWILFFVSLTNG